MRGLLGRGLLAAAAGAMPAGGAEAAIFMKFGEIEGEAKTSAPNDSSGKEHEVEYDLAVGASANDGKLRARSAVRSSKREGHADEIEVHGVSWDTMSASSAASAAADLAASEAAGKPATFAGQRIPARRGAGEITLKRGLTGCVPGTRYQEVELWNDETGERLTLHGVEITGCRGGGVSLEFDRLTTG